MGYFSVPIKDPKECTIKDFLESALQNLNLLNKANPSMHYDYLVDMAQAQINNAIIRYNRSIDDLK